MRSSGTSGPMEPARRRRSACYSASSGRRRGARRSSGSTASADAVEAHRRLAYVPGEANLWPSLTGAETLHLLGQVQGRVDIAYRDELVERFDLDPSKKVRAYSKGNRQKLLLIAGLMTPARPPDPRRADQRARPPDGAGLPSQRDRGQASAARPSSCPRTSSPRSKPCATGSGSCGTGSRRHREPGPDAPSLLAQRRGHLRRHRPRSHPRPGVSGVQVDGRVVRCQVQGSVEPLLKVLANSGVHEMLCREPSLEELFLAHYGGSTDASDGHSSDEQGAERVG